MIISDLNYFETADAAVVGGSRKKGKKRGGDNIKFIAVNKSYIDDKDFAVSINVNKAKFVKDDQEIYSKTYVDSYNYVEQEIEIKF
jgi:hypothetical protein